MPSIREIQRERKERLKLFGSRFDEPPDLIPVELSSVDPGAVCRLWFMPNQSHFVVAGTHRDSVKIVMEGGVIAGFQPTALVVIVSLPPADFPPLVSKIEAFEQEMAATAWVGRQPEVSR